MDFRLLGPFEVRRDGVPLVLSARKPRTILAMLVAEAGRVVSADRMIGELWADPPASAISNLRTYISRLRHEVFGGADSRLVSEAGGWRLRLESAGSGAGSGSGANGSKLAPVDLSTGRPGSGDLARDNVDVAEFEHWADVGERAASGAEALRAYDLALRLWRGQPFGGVDGGPMLSAAASALEERYAAIIEESFDIRLGGSGSRTAASTADLVAELRRHIVAYPLRERPRQQLMVALYRAGDPAAALRAYADARVYFRDVLGLDPGVGLRRTQRAILRRDPVLELPVPARTDRTTNRPPAQVAVFGERLEQAMAVPLAASGAIVLCRTESIARVVRASGGVAVRLADAASAVAAADAVIGLDGSWETMAAVGLAKQRSDVPVVVVGASGSWADVEVVGDPGEAVRCALGRGNRPGELSASR